MNARFAKGMGTIAVAGIIACTGGSSGGDLDASASSSGGSSGAPSSSSSSSSSSSGATGSTDVKDEGFSKVCATDDDCVPVYFGGTCGFCNGSNAAIAKSAQPAWQSAYNAARSHCPPNNALGTCAAQNYVTQCDATKTCVFVSCGNFAQSDPHHCTDGGI